MSVHDLIDVPLTDDERRLLRHGLLEWGGPARCTDAMAVAMGFDDVEDLFRESDRLRVALAQGDPLTQRDWVRTLLATEIVFVSDVLGSGWDWSITTGFPDDETIRLLRGVQRRSPPSAPSTCCCGLVALSRGARCHGLPPDPERHPSEIGTYALPWISRPSNHLPPCACQSR